MHLISSSSRIPNLGKRGQLQDFIDHLSLLDCDIGPISLSRIGVFCRTYPATWPLLPLPGFACQACRVARSAQVLVVVVLPGGIRASNSANAGRLMGRSTCPVRSLQTLQTSGYRRNFLLQGGCSRCRRSQAQPDVFRNAFRWPKIQPYH